MNRDQRRFGKLLTENNPILKGPRTQGDLKSNLQPHSKHPKRLTENDVTDDDVKRQKSENSDPENSVVQNKLKKDCKELHVRRLDLDDKKAAVPARVTRSSVHKLRVSTEGPVDPQIVAARQEIDFGDPTTYYRPPKDLPPEVEDFDRTQLADIASESHYAQEVFEYYREKELKYRVPKYMSQQTQITRTMRSVLVDWMVEVQESFELNHETLYLAVKMVDHYLVKKVVAKDRFQLLGATCLLMASKYDERIPPSIEDFIYICDDAYTKKDIIGMEMEVFKRLNFFIGFPISYRFQRRFARCAKLSMETLTLARYILETSLMEYDFVDELDSKMAASTLLLALKMKDMHWGRDLEFYSKYKESDLHSLMCRLNDIIATPAKSNVKTIRSKYSHPIFYEVAKVAPLPKQSTSQ